MPAALAAVLCAGCATPVPFKEIERVPVAGMDPEKVRRAFAEAIPNRCKVANTAVFSMWGRQQTGIGYASLDADARAFSVTCMNPIGVKLFDLKGDDESISCRLAVAGVERKDDFARAAAADVRDIYFDLAPGPNARVRKTRDSIVFRETRGEAGTEYVFGGSAGVLVEKRMGSRRRVRYFEYVERAGKLFPRGIILDDDRYGYRLTIRLKEILEND